MTLADESVLLRPWREEDVPAIAAACADPEIARWTSVPEPYGEEEARAFIAGAHELAFAVVDASSGQLLGAIGLERLEGRRGEIGYWIARGARGRGVAPRALRLLSRWALAEGGFARVQLMTEPENRASQRVAEKAGFRREGILRSYAELKGRRRDFVVYSLLPGDDL